jgi:thiamine-monophosphate kinase
MKLQDIGEFAILRNFLLPALGDLGQSLGDDCAILSLSDELSLVLTSDYAARPLAWSLEGVQIDFADAGWLAVVASVSDLATAGAAPFAITNDIEAPETMDVEDLRRFAVGVAEACRELGFRHAGGDLAKSSEFTTHCTAIGLLHGKYRVGRRQCRPGDHVIALGPMGAFCAAYLYARRKGLGELSLDQRRALFRPTPQLATMQNLVGRGLINGASDCSDGVIGGLVNLTEASGLGIELETSRIQIPEHVTEEGAVNNLSPWNLLFFWGDWQVVVTTDRLEEVLNSVDPTNAMILGRVIEEQKGLWAKVGMRSSTVAPVRNENFTQAGFASDLADHLRFMLETPLF